MNLLKLPIAIFVLPLILISEGCDKNDDAKEHLDKGVEYFKSGDYEKSALELKTSSQSDKNTAETYYYLALLDEKNRQFKAMRENLNKSIELSPGNNQARLKLGKLQLLYGEFDSALEQVQEILANTPKNQEALLLKATVYIKQQKQAVALTIVNDILKNNPDYAEALALKSFITVMDNGNVDEALSLIDSAIKNDTKNIELRLFKIQLDYKKSNINSVINDYKELINLYPDNDEFKIALARVYSQDKKIPEAEELLQNLADNEHKNNEVKLKFLLLDFLSAISKERAEEQFRRFVEKHHDEPRRLLNLSRWVIARKNYAEAKNVLNRVIELEDDTDVALAAKTLLAKMAFDNQEFDEAEKIINDILKTNSNYNDAKIMLARLLVTKSKYAEALAQLNEVIWNIPNSEEALLLLGQVSTITGDQKQADKYYADLLHSSPGNSQAVIFAHDKAIRNHDTKYAKSLLERGIMFNPGNLLLLEKLARINVDEKNWDIVKAVIQKIAGTPNYLAKDLAKFLTGDLLQAQGEYIKAVGLFKELAIQFPDNADVLRNLSHCYEMLNQRAEAIKFLNELSGKNPGSVAIGVRLGNLLLKDKQFEKVEELLANLLKNNTNPQLYILLAELKLAQNNTRSAITVYQDGLKSNPENVNLSLSLASLYAKQGDYDLAVSEYETLLSKKPNNDVVINNLASILIEHYDEKEKINRAVQLTQRFKDSDLSYYRDTYAWGLVKQGNVSEALNVLNQIITMDPDVPIFRYHLGFTHHKNGNNAAAMAELGQSLELSKNKGDFYGKKSAEMLLNEIRNKTR